MDAHIKLKDWWTHTGADIAIWAATPDLIERITQRYNLVLPADFHRFLAEGSPLADNWDDEMGSWWPVGRIKNIPDEYESALPPFILNEGQKYLFFLDHCVWSWAWAISCEQDRTFGKVALIGGLEERFVADSFSDFVDRYTSDWLSVS